MDDAIKDAIVASVEEAINRTVDAQKSEYLQTVALEIFVSAACFELAVRHGVPYLVGFLEAGIRMAKKVEGDL